MKCDTCKYKMFHHPGSWQSVVEGGDDPYPYYYCDKYHWGGDGPEPENSTDSDIDPWKDCEDFKPEKP